MKKRNDLENLMLPTINELESELEYEKYRDKYKNILRSTIYILIVVVAISVLLATLMFPVLKICGKSMNPTLIENDIVLCIKEKRYKQGDIIAFYYNNQILVKRVIGSAGEWVNIDINGNVFINDKLLNEPYIKEKSLGDSDIEFPYQVPENSYFVMGEERENSIDSRNSLIGTVKNEEIIGKILIKIWPLKRIGIVR